MSKEKKSILTRLKGSRPVRALAQRSVAVRNEREREREHGARAGAWRPPSGAWTLERMRLLERLPASEIAALARDAAVVVYARRSVKLIDDDASHVWFLLEGGLKICRASMLGQRLIEAILGPGDAFGRLSSVTQTAAYEVHALEASRVAAIPRDRFEALLRRHPQLGFAVLQQLETRQRTLVRRLESLVFKDVHARVAETLLELAREHGDPCEHGFAIDVRITQQDIAELVGASRQMVNRVLGDFERQLYIARMGRVTCVLHRERLERLVERSGV